jgi:hemerythrin
MTALTWTDALRLQHDELDRTHEEFVALLNALSEVLPGGDPLPALRALIAHTEAHFALEEGWMQRLGFEPENCHSRQHQMVPDLLREVEQRALGGETDALPRLVPALAEWFPQHAEMMDAALVFSLQQGAPMVDGSCS